MPKAVELYFTETGSGPPLLLLHGLFGNGGNLAGLAKGLADDFRILNVDLRNHGRSPHSRIMDYPALSSDIIALMDRQNIDTAFIVGHSLGGKIGMATALFYPERVRQLAVLDIAPAKYRRGSSTTIQFLCDLPLDEIKTRADADMRLAKDIPDERVRNFMLQNLIPTESGMKWRVNLTALRDNRKLLADFPHITTPYTGPTLFLYGGQSGYIWPEHHDNIRKYFPNADILAIAGAGHWLHIERPKEVLDALRVFLTVELGSLAPQ